MLNNCFPGMHLMLVLYLATVSSQALGDKGFLKISMT